MSIDYVVGQVLERTPATFLRQISGQSGALITQAEIASITYDVYIVPMTRSRYQQLIGNIPVQSSSLIPVASNVVVTPIVQNETLVVADTIFNTPQLDDRWTKGGVGYNFATTLPGSTFPANSLSDYPNISWLEVWFTFTPTVGDKFSTPFLVSKAFMLANRPTGTGTGT